MKKTLSRLLYNSLALTYLFFSKKTKPILKIKTDLSVSFKSISKPNLKSAITSPNLSKT